MKLHEMTARWPKALLILGVFVLAGSLQAQVTYRIFTHKSHDICFEAPMEWIIVDHPDDRMMYEVRDEGSVLHAKLWYTETEVGSPTFIQELATKQGLNLKKGAKQTSIKGNLAWMAVAEGMKDEGKYTVWYITLPQPGALYVMTLEGPRKPFRRNRDIMEHIMESIEIF